MSECFATANGIQICYETMGDSRGRPLLLIMGLSGPLTWWEDEFCQMLTERGFYVIRYDNRDSGRSTHVTTGVRTRPLRASLQVTGAYLRVVNSAAYTLNDMADDAAGLLDHLGIAAAHVTGVSMGGMIGQTLAIRHPERVLSLVSIASTTGSRLVGQPNPRLVRILLGRMPRSRERYIASAVRMSRLIGSPGYTFNEERIRRLAGETYDRGFSRSAFFRQLAAILIAQDRTPNLRQVTVPALVIHGAADRLVHVSGGRATAHALPRSRLLVLPGMGHDLEPELWPVFAHGIDRTARGI
jgi:pimeloyl-ACP methyl ester carboxylesterase